MAQAIGHIAEYLIAELPEVTYSADGAADPRPSYNLLDGSSANARMTLANASAVNTMNKKLMIFEASDVSNTVDLDYNDSSGATTETFTAAGQVLVLLGTANGVWKKLA